MPDFDLAPIDLEQLDLHFNPSRITAEDSQRSTLSPHNSQLMSGSRHSLPTLNIPGRSSSLMGGPVGGGGSFGIRGDSGAGLRHHDELLFDDDLGITVDADGTMRFSEGLPTVPSGRVDRTVDASAGFRDRTLHRIVEPGHGTVSFIA